MLSFQLKSADGLLRNLRNAGNSLTSVLGAGEPGSSGPAWCEGGRGGAR